jgi:hypothetical protein
MSALRSSIRLQCPSEVVVARDVAATFGVGHPKNMSSCTLILSAKDERGNLLGDIEILGSGNMIEWFRVPGAAIITVSCTEACSEEGILEYDTPVA